MTRRAFTLVELAIVLSCLAVMVPAVWLLDRGIESDLARAAARLDAAASMRALSEELRDDLGTMKLEDGGAGAFPGDEGPGGAGGGCAGRRTPVAGDLGP